MDKLIIKQQINDEYKRTQIFKAAMDFVDVLKTHSIGAKDIDKVVGWAKNMGLVENLKLRLSHMVYSRKLVLFHNIIKFFI